MDRQQVMQIAQADPRVQQAVQMLQQQIGDMPVTPEGLEELIGMLEMALENPEQYAQIRAAAIADGMVDAEDLPEQFNPTVIVSILVLLYGMQGSQSQAQPQQAFARGGLAEAANRLRAAGRNGDSILAHISPEEAQILRMHGGSGRINPATGLPEYGWFSSLIKIAAPIALSVIAPGVGTAIGGAMGLSGTAASIVGGALLNAGTSALTGGDPLKGALLGGLTGGLGSAVGSTLAPTMSNTAQNLIGSGIVGGMSGALTGGNVLRGAAQGALGAYAGQKFGELGTGAVGAGTQAAGKTFGNMMSAGYSPKEAAVGSALSGIATAMTSPRVNNAPGLKMKPSDAVVEGLKPTVYQDSVVSDPAAQYSLSKIPSYSGNVNIDYSLTGQAPAGSNIGSSGSGLQSVPMEAQSGLLTPSGTDYTNKIMNAVSNISPTQLLAGAALLGSLSSAPQPVQQAVQKLSPDQQEYFNRPSISWDWDRMQNDATAANQDLGTFMAKNWPQITSGQYNSVKKAQGGSISPLARFAQGSGSGRADTIDARLSDGEYVMDAETVALLGDGSSKAGAQRLDQMREQIRKHKGKTLARGKFSPNAKSPLAYLKGAV